MRLGRFLLDCPATRPSASLEGRFGRPAALLLTPLLALTVIGCDQGSQDAPQAQPTAPILQTPVPRQTGFPPEQVIPMPPEEPGTMPPGFSPEPSPTT